jgi:Uma2 family endonuclease
MNSTKGSSKCREYHNQNEYLIFGVREYWIVDAQKKQFLAMTRFRGKWKSKAYRSTQKFTTPLLPGFVLDIKRVFAAAK